MFGPKSCLCAIKYRLFFNYMRFVIQKLFLLNVIQQQSKGSWQMLDGSWMVVFDKDLKMLPLLEHSRSIACSAYIWHRANIFEHLPRGNELRISIVIFFSFPFLPDAFWFCVEYAI